MHSKGFRALSVVCNMLKIPMWDDWLEEQVPLLPLEQQIAIRSRMDWERHNMSTTDVYDLDTLTQDRLRQANLPHDKDYAFFARFYGLYALKEECEKKLPFLLEGEEYPNLKYIRL